MGNINIGAILKYAGGLMILIGIVNPILNTQGYTIKAVPPFSWTVGIIMAVVGAGMLYYGWKMGNEKKDSSQTNG